MQPDDKNPFAAPQSEQLVSDPRFANLPMAWRDGEQLVVRDGAKLPSRCVKCNWSHDIRRLNRRLTWHSPVLYLLIFFNVIIYVIVAVVVQKRATVNFGLCALHLRQRRIAIVVGLLGTVAFVAMLIGAISLPPARGQQIDYTFPIVGLAFLVLVGALIYTIVWSQPLKPTRIDGGVMWLKGAGSDFLESIDEEFRRQTNTM